jgi:hypothetical protein
MPAGASSLDIESSSPTMLHLFRSNGHPCCRGEWNCPKVSRTKTSYLLKSRSLCHFAMSRRHGRIRIRGRGWISIAAEGVTVVAKKPVILPAAGSYLPPLSVEITCETVNAEIWYTLDASEPTRGAPALRYQGAIALNGTGTTLLKAKAFGDALTPSHLAEARAAFNGFTLTTTHGLSFPISLPSTGSRRA